MRIAALLAFGFHAALAAPAFTAVSHTHPDGWITLPAIHEPQNDAEPKTSARSEAFSDILFAYCLHRIHAQLTATNILVSLGRYDEAAIHTAAQPLELYEMLADEIDRRHITSFGYSLAELAAAVEEKHQGSSIYPLIVKLQSAIWGAYDTIPYHRREALDFKLDLAVMILNQAASEYRMAWQGLKLSNLDNFQSAYGLVLEARLLLSRAVPMVRKKDTRKARNIEDAFIRVQGAFQSIDPPRKPVLPSSTINGLVASIEVNARKASR